MSAFEVKRTWRLHCEMYRREVLPRLALGRIDAKDSLWISGFGRIQGSFPLAAWYWGDERFVPYDHPEGNFRMTREAMLDPQGRRSGAGCAGTTGRRSCGLSTELRLAKGG
jgi:hypothetical protein